MSKFSQLATIATNTDSYKVTMFREYPPGTEYVYSYIEARGGVYEQTVFMGLLPAIKQHLLTPITKEQILFAEKFWAANGMEFNTNGWMKIIENHKGLLPIRIKAVPEGSVIPVKNVLCTVENTDPEFYWLTTWVETMILRAIWYATTVCTLSWNVKQDIKAYLEKSGDVNGLSYKFHDFGYRGVSSDESAAIGATSHLVNFMGTDTVAALFYAI